MSLSIRSDLPVGSRILLALVAMFLAAAVLAGRADAAAWGPPTTISNPIQSEKVQLGSDSAGDQIAVWMSREGSEWIVEGATRPAGGNWGAPVAISAPGPDLLNAALAVNSAGEAIASWSRGSVSESRIEVARGDASGNWGIPTAISAAGESSFEPRLGLDAAGNAIASWRQLAEPNYVVVVAVEAGGTWGAPRPFPIPLTRTNRPGWRSMPRAMRSSPGIAAKWSKRRTGRRVAAGARRPPWRPAAILINRRSRSTHRGTRRRSGPRTKGSTR